MVADVFDMLCVSMWATNRQKKNYQGFSNDTIWSEITEFLLLLLSSSHWVFLSFWSIVQSISNESTHLIHPNSIPCLCDIHLKKNMKWHWFSWNRSHAQANQSTSPPSSQANKLVWMFRCHTVLEFLQFIRPHTNCTTYGCTNQWKNVRWKLNSK